MFDVIYAQSGEPKLFGVLKFGYKDAKGKVLVKKKYSDALEFSEGMAALAKGKWAWDLKWGFIDVTGKEVIPLQFPIALSFSDGLAGVLSEGDYFSGKWGFIDKTGKVVIPFLYHDTKGHTETDENGKRILKGFSEGLACVKLDDKWGYIDKSGEIVIPFDFDNAESFKNGFARVSRFGIAYSIDKSGNEVRNGMKDYIKGLRKVAQNGRFEYVDTTGVVLFSTLQDFDEIEIFTDGVAILSKTETMDFSMTLKSTTSNKTTAFNTTTTTYTTTSNTIKGWRTYDTVTQGLIDKNGEEIIPIQKQQKIVRHNDGIFEIYKERVIVGVFIPDYLPTGKFYDSSGKQVKRNK